ncbi:ubiquitin carboxyl-terminal hydrolase 4-like [Amphiura filiformis]|uniref:ubiquitin carboxyl-terminal hydrolase 4-like n=1 Tax=Amphiura filiformis TaxID=82378 RepID=UPI003B219CF7
MAEGGGPPELQTQKKEISELINTTLVKGDTWFLIDSKWFKQWKKYVGFDSWDAYNMGNSSFNPGPIDNSGLIKDGTENHLKEHLIDDLDYILVPQEAWDKLVEWYGSIESQEPIDRKVVEYGMFVKHCKVEVYLMELKLCENGKPDKFVTQQFSKADTIETIENKMRKLFNISDDTDTRVWNKYMSNTYEHLNKKENTVQDAGLYQGQVLVIEKKNEDGSWPRQSSVSSSSSASSSSAASTSTYNGSSTGLKDSNKVTRNSTNSSGYGSYSSSYSGYGGSTSGYDYNYRNSSRSSASVTPGICGLSNLGNTCFMNSALQCMSNVPPLTQYFINDDYKDELNTNNPLGMHGEIAKSYADLIKQIWSGHHTYTIPRNFKMQVGRFAPQFSGFQQQDSQELLAFLLDGLHEDLNRILKKPYIESKDSDGRNDEVVSKESWDNHLKRNNSIITDLYHGQFKSTLVCPECSKVSVTFDPFCFLSLPLPIKKERTLEVFVVSMEPQSKPVQMKVSVPKMGIVFDLCKSVSKVTQIPPEKMAVTDVYNHRFHKVFAPNDRIDSITDRDDIFVYEVPVTVADNPDTVIIPVYLREKSNRHSTYQYSAGSYSLYGTPMLVAVPRKNTNYHDLYDIMLKKMERYVTEPENNDWWEEGAEEGNEVTENGETEMDSDSDSQDQHNSSEDAIIPSEKEASLPETKENGKSSETIEEPMPKPVEQKKCRLFGMTLVNSYGSADVNRLHDDGNPIKFTNRTYIALDWNPKAKEKFYNDQLAEEYEQHESMSYRTSSRRQAVDLSDCINLFLTEEILEKEDSWYCPDCKKHQEASKKFDLWKLPKVLVVHLKRFSYTRFWRDKLDTMVNFPLTNMDMTPHVKGPNGQEYVYDLMSVTNHYGGLGGGHYTAYGRNAKTRHWYNFDDSSVSKADRDSVVSKAAYVLFYVRKDCFDFDASSSTSPASLAQPEEDENASGMDNEAATTTNARVRLLMVAKYQTVKIAWTPTKHNATYHLVTGLLVVNMGSSS